MLVYNDQCLYGGCTGRDGSVDSRTMGSSVTIIIITIVIILYWQNNFTATRNYSYRAK